MTKKVGNKIRLIGDDLYVTNVQRLAKGIKSKASNAILIKPNQIGTLSETIATVQMAHKVGFAAVVSHRSGETEDTTIADISVGLNTGADQDRRAVPLGTTGKVQSIAAH